MKKKILPIEISNLIIDEFISDFDKKLSVIKFKIDYLTLKDELNKINKINDQKKIDKEKNRKIQIMYNNLEALFGIDFILDDCDFITKLSLLEKKININDKYNDMYDLYDELQRSKQQYIDLKIKYNKLKYSPTHRNTHG